MPAPAPALTPQAPPVASASHSRLGVGSGNLRLILKTFLDGVGSMSI